MVNLYIEGQLIDQYSDESVEIMSSVLDLHLNVITKHLNTGTMLLLMEGLMRGLVCVVLLILMVYHSKLVNGSYVALK